MIQFLMKRDYFPTHTYGVWYQGDLPVGLYSIEKPWLDNDNDTSCIPAGTYNCTLYNSPRHNKIVYLINDVPNRTGVEFDIANLQSSLEGCVGMGLSFGVLKNEQNEDEAAVLNSSAALAKLMALTNNQEFSLTIT